jgi:hypothetical protein
MGKYRSVALKGHDGTSREPVPYGYWYQSMKGDYNHVVSKSELSIQYFSALAYGYKALAAWYYATSGGDGSSTFFNGPADQNPTPEFYHVAQLNKQTLNLAPSLLRLLSTDVRFVLGKHKTKAGTIAFNPQPGFASEWTSSADPYITAIRAANISSEYDSLPGDIIIGYFKPLFEKFESPPAGKDQIYFMIVNGLISPDSNIDTTQKIRVDFDFGKSGIDCIYRLSRNTGKVEKIELIHDSGSQYHYEFDLKGGEGDLFSFHNFYLP